jgi:ElaB/YqjD/DUF883 family membrane-anchored ribosome-binding protein
MPTNTISGSTRDATSEAKSAVDSAADRIQGIADQAMRQVFDLGEVSGKVKKAVDSSLRSQPYATLGIAAALGFIVGAVWKS